MVCKYVYNIERQTDEKLGSARDLFQNNAGLQSAMWPSFVSGEGNMKTILLFYKLKGVTRVVTGMIKDWGFFRKYIYN